MVLCLTSRVVSMMFIQWSCSILATSFTEVEPTPVLYTSGELAADEECSFDASTSSSSTKLPETTCEDEMQDTTTEAEAPPTRSTESIAPTRFSLPESSHRPTTSRPTTHPTSNRPTTHPTAQTTKAAKIGTFSGSRFVSKLEYPYVVSIIHKELRLHICTGVLLTTTSVLTYIRCAVRKRVQTENSEYKLADGEGMAVTSGILEVEANATDSFERAIMHIFTPHRNIFKCELILLVIQEIPVSIFHWPVKLYSKDLNVIGKNLERYSESMSCEVITWGDTVIQPGTKIKRPRGLEAYRVKVLTRKQCGEQEIRLGVPLSSAWNSKLNQTTQMCFAGMGGRRCGSAPGGPLLCAKAIYGIMTLGTSCSEFGDYTFFVPLNSSELDQLMDRLPKQLANEAKPLKTSDFILLRAVALLALAAVS